MAELKKRVDSLENEIRRLLAEAKKQKTVVAQKPAEEAGKARFSAKGIRRLRSKLGITQADFTNILGAAPHSVYLWEEKENPLNLRDKTKKALLSFSGKHC